MPKIIYPQHWKQNLIILKYLVILRIQVPVSDSGVPFILHQDPQEEEHTPRATPYRPVQPARERRTLPHTQFAINSLTQLSGVRSIALVKNCSHGHDSVSEIKFKNFIVSFGEMLLTGQSFLQLN